MANFNSDLVRKLAMGDAEAHEEIKSLPLTVRLSLGNAVDQLRRDENIVPMSSGMSVYEQQKSAYVDDDAVREAMQRRSEIEKVNRERQEKAREEFIKEQTRQAVERARSGLTRNDRLPR
ncbi:hypothetical protein J1907_06410 [Lysinibacillus sphaericus]|uniref:hypothetical protein n=1 Tax=Lysinibacillus sphaericus TaxID=1421 RepID=UPI00056806C2|nr:hypothetical protein [Lysinibacillus sphaericus]QTB23709.1 hypothetical protein J1907_06410 [Lysinibacillus sphaericus]